MSSHLVGPLTFRNTEGGKQPNNLVESLPDNSEDSLSSKDSTSSLTLSSTASTDSTISSSLKSHLGRNSKNLHLESQIPELDEPLSNLDLSQDLDGTSSSSDSCEEEPQLKDAVPLGPHQPKNQREIDSRSIYVSNIPFKISPWKLKQIFTYGTPSIPGCGENSINRVTIVCDRYSGLPKGYAYIEFSDKKYVENSLRFNGLDVDGRNIEVYKKRTNLPWINANSARKHFYLNGNHNDKFGNNYNFFSKHGTFKNISTENNHSIMDSNNNSMDKINNNLRDSNNNIIDNSNNLMDNNNDYMENNNSFMDNSNSVTDNNYKTKFNDLMGNKNNDNKQFGYFNRNFTKHRNSNYNFLNHDLRNTKYSPSNFKHHNIPSKMESPGGYSSVDVNENKDSNVENRDNTTSEHGHEHELTNVSSPLGSDNSLEGSVSSNDTYHPGGMSSRGRASRGVRGRGRGSSRGRGRGRGSSRGRGGLALHGKLVIDDHHYLTPSSRVGIYNNSE